MLPTTARLLIKNIAMKLLSLFNMCRIYGILYKDMKQQFMYLGILDNIYHCHSIKESTSDFIQRNFESGL
jgi:hypothetical protein